MKTLKDLRDELLGVRLYATNTSLWYLGTTLTEAARTAINEALQTYEFTVKRTFNSLNLPDTGKTVAVIPRDIERVVECYARSTTTADIRRHLIGYEHRATVDTNFLYLDARAFPGARNVVVEYETRLKEAPPHLVIAETISAGSLHVAVSGGVPSVEWRAPGYFAVYPQVDTTERELIRFAAVTDSGFTGLARAFGYQTVQAKQWSAGSEISPVLEIPTEGIPVIQAAAQASMYHFWVRNRALYDEYTAVASFQSLDLGDLLGLVRSEEDRADRAYKRVKKPPEPTHAHRKRVRR